MHDPKSEVLELVTERVVSLQRSLVLNSEQRSQIQRQHRNTVQNLCLSILEGIDLIERLESESDAGPYLTKIKRKILSGLQQQGLKEWIPENVDQGNVRVIESRQNSGQTSGRVLQICKKGYNLGDVNIRTAEVISACD